MGDDVEKIHYADLASKWLKPRTKDWHKGMSGHVLVVGGELGYSGAPRMAGEAALRVGAGLVSVATRPENALAMNAERPELMCHGVNNANELTPLLKKADVIVLGPGLGKTDWSIALWRAALAQEKPLVVDADALNLLAEEKDYREGWVLTPHVGEAARLLGETTQVVQQNRPLAITEMVKRYGGVCVLKGAGSLVLSSTSSVTICDQGNPGMATAGMGDILSGVIGGLIAQHIPLLEAAKLGVCMHAMAGDLAAKETQRGLIATDLLPYLRQLANVK